MFLGSMQLTRRNRNTIEVYAAALPNNVHSSRSFTHCLTTIGPPIDISITQMLEVKLRNICGCVHSLIDHHSGGGTERCIAATTILQ